jgi:hypothetical protein
MAELFGAGAHIEGLHLGPLLMLGLNTARMWSVLPSFRSHLLQNGLLLMLVLFALCR